MTRKTAQETDTDAAIWAARLDRGLSVDESRAFQEWLAGDFRRPGAFARIRALALSTERAQALGPGFDPANFDPTHTELADFASAHSAPAILTSRRALLRGGGAVAAAVLMGSAVAWEAFIRGPRFRTGKGEMKVIALEDGSVLTLNTESEIAVGFTKQQRSIRMIRGEVLFDVAGNPARPFVVAAGDTQVRVVGTSFTVRRLDAAPVQVLVREGLVEVFKPAAQKARPILIPANTRAVAAQDDKTINAHPVAQAQLHRELAWQDGRIAFEGQTLAQAAAEFARYSDTKIVIDDPGLAKEEIAGLFQANDPVGFAETIAVSLNAHTHIGEGEVRLTR